MQRILLALFCLSALPASAMAQPIDSYIARLSANDHFNSSGKKLDEAAAIIRQDRANFYIFAKLDPEDESDLFFSDKSNRMRLEKMLKRGQLSSDVEKVILSGTPVIYVEVFQDYINVSIKDH